MVPPSQISVTDQAADCGIRIRYSQMRSDQNLVQRALVGKANLTRWPPPRPCHSWIFVGALYRRRCNRGGCFTHTTMLRSTDLKNMGIGVQFPTDQRFSVNIQHCKYGAQRKAIKSVVAKAGASIRLTAQVVTGCLQTLQSKQTRRMMVARCPVKIPVR